VVLLARDFVVLVAAAALVAAPVAYLAMDRWLDDFAYRVELGPLLFVAAGLVALVIALATVSGQAFRAATADPVKALRTE
jgi:putative ABC transport system permease protein